MPASPRRLAALLLCLLPLSARAWGPHPEITQAAIDTLPADDPLRGELGEQIGQLHEYCWMADWRRTLRREPASWFYTDDYLLFPPMPSHVEHICPGVKKTYDPYFRRALQALRTESPVNAARWIGSIIHFTEDTGSPPHAAEVLGPIHSKMENWVDPKAIHLPGYQPQLLGDTEEAAVAGFVRRMDGLIAFSRERFDRAKPHVEAEDRPGTEPIVLESALESSRVVADLLHTLGVLAARPSGGGELSGRATFTAAPGLEKMPTKIVLAGTLYSTLAEPDGTFQFHHLPPGKYELIGVSSGGDPTRAAASVEEGKTARAELAPTSQTSNLLRNPALEALWLGSNIPDDWTPLHRRGEEPHWESESVPMTPGKPYRLRVSWKAGAQGQVLVHLQDKQGLQGLGKDLETLQPGQTEMSFTGDAEHLLAQVFIYASQPAVMVQRVVLEPAAPVSLLDQKEHRLGLADKPEWRDFGPREAEFLQLRFSAHPNAGAATLFVRQRDVKLAWAVLLNGRKLGTLELNETPLVAHLEVPPGALREGENSLTIASPQMPDDIAVSDLRLDPRPPGEAISECTLQVHVHDRQTDAGLPCRITVVDESHALAPLLAQADGPLAVRTGVIYTRDGEAELRLRSGSYTVFATRGPEYSLAKQIVTIAAGQTQTISLTIEREVPTPGLVACDTHIHTFTLSRHGDASLDERMLTLAGEGVELAIATDHNLYADYREAARRVGVQRWFTPVIGDEVTTKTGHFNIFPVAGADLPLPDFKLPSWPELFASMRAVPGVQVIVLNHPRDLHDGFIPFAPENFNPVTGDNLRGPDFTFDAIEVANSGTLQSDYLRSFRDWFALLNHGYRVTAVGSSDSHDVSRFIVGQGRTYIAAEDRDPGTIDINAACQSLRSGHALVSLGLLARLTVDDRFGPGDLATGLGRQMRIHVRVLGPSWLTADHVTLFADGVSIREQTLAPTAAVDKASIDWSIPTPPHDVYLVAIASGPGVSEPFWNIPFPYQPTDGLRDPRVLAATNPIWVDADGDGKFTSARAYAQRLVESHLHDPGGLCAALASYDEAIAAQAAGLAQHSGLKLGNEAFTAALAAGAPATRRGFAAYLATVATDGPVK